MQNEGKIEQENHDHIFVRGLQRYIWESNMWISIVKSTNQNRIYVLLRINIDLPHQIREVKLNFV